MSKEVEEKIGDGFEFDIHFYGDAGRRCLIEYIDQRAKEVAIGFGKFVSLNSLVWTDGRWEDNKYPQRNFTDEQLYQQYLKSK